MTEKTSPKPFVKPTIHRISLAATNKFTGSYLKVVTASEVDGRPVRDLIAAHGSPLYVVSEETLLQRFREMRDAFKKRYLLTTVAYSYKTNYLSGICAILHKEGAWAEVVSGFEYEIAGRLGVTGDRIVFNGPYKRPEDLRRAFSEDAMVNLDSFDELELAGRVAQGLGRKVKVGVRVNMNVNYPAWDKFGFSLELGEAFDACRRISIHPHLSLAGFHCHVGTYVIDLSVYRRMMENLLSLAIKVQGALGAMIDYLDVGGGYGSKNTLHSQLMPGETTCPTPDQYAETICGALNERLTEFKAPPRLFLEPGRSVVDECMTLLSTVVAVKSQATGVKCAIIDAGVNLLPTAYYYKHDVKADKDFTHVSEQVDIYGPLCMQIDVIRKGVTLPYIQVGDVITIRNVGAYNFSQSMQFIFPRPAVVLVGKHGVEVLKEAESFDDIKRLEKVPERLLPRRGQ